MSCVVHVQDLPRHSVVVREIAIESGGLWYEGGGEIIARRKTCKLSNTFAPQGEPFSSYYLRRKTRWEEEKVYIICEVKIGCVILNDARRNLIKESQQITTAHTYKLESRVEKNDAHNP